MNEEELRKEQVLRFTGQVRVLFNSEIEAEDFLCTHIFPLVEGVRDGDTLVYKPEKEVNADMTYAAKKVEDFFSMVFCSKAVQSKGFFVLFGDNGFILKYEPETGINAFKFVSINGLLGLSVDELKDILDKHLYSRRRDRNGL